MLPLAGQLAPRFGSGRATALLGVAFVITLPLPAFAPNMAALCVVLFALGAANGALDVSMNGHASTIETQWRAPIMSSFHAAWSAGGLLGAATGALLQKNGVGVAGGLLVPAMSIAVLIICAATRWRCAIHHAGRGFKRIRAWPSGGVMKLALLAFLCMLVEGAVADWSAVLALAIEPQPASPRSAIRRLPFRWRRAGSSVMCRCDASARAGWSRSAV